MDYCEIDLEMLRIQKRLVNILRGKINGEAPINLEYLEKDLINLEYLEEMKYPNPIEIELIKLLEDYSIIGMLLSKGDNGKMRAHIEKDYYGFSLDI